MDLDDVVILNPDYHFKNDLDRVVIYSKNKVASYSSLGWKSYIHPMQALVLSMFSTCMPLKEQLKLLSEKFKLSIEKVQNLISPYINNEQPFHTEFALQEIFFPKNVLITMDRISPEHIKYDIDVQDFKCDNIDLTPDRMHKSPLSLLYMLTSKCVTSCKYCYADKKTKCEEMDTIEILELIKECKRLKLAYIDVIGGEIFCKKDWNIILQALVDSDLTPTYISTKVPITENIARLLYQTGYNNVIQISLDSLNEDILRKTIGVKLGYLENIKKGINILQEYGFKIQIDSILTRYNTTKEEMQKLYEYVSVIKKLVYWEVRVPGASIYTPQTFSEIKADKAELLAICSFVEEEIIPRANIDIHVSKNELVKTFRKGKCDASIFRECVCGVLKDRLFILPDGKVSLCEQLYWHPQFIIGDLRKQSLEEIWQSEKAKSMYVWKKDFYQGSKSQCVQCKAFDFCHDDHRKCWLRVIQAYGEEHWDYPDPCCEFAPQLLKDAMYS